MKYCRADSIQSQRNRLAYAIDSENGSLEWLQTENDQGSTIYHYQFGRDESEPMMTAFESCVSRYAISAYSVLSKTGFVQALQPHRHDLCRSTLGC